MRRSAHQPLLPVMARQFLRCITGIAMRPFEVVAYEWRWVPGEDAYVTDGRSLFRLERAEHDEAGEPVLVLEHCRTLERVLCTPRALIG